MIFAWQAISMQISLVLSENKVNNSKVDTNKEVFQYVGFWVRFGASIVDTIILIMITFPILFLIYGGEYFYRGETVQGWLDFIVSYVFPISAIILFWVYKSATPGKIALLAKIVDVKTGNKPSLKQSIVRYLGYYVSLIPLGLGFFWIAWDAKKQGWHDKMAGTVVIRVKNNADENG